MNENENAVFAYLRYSKKRVRAECQAQCSIFLASSQPWLENRHLSDVSVALEDGAKRVTDAMHNAI